jgi:hypothetical protein
VHENRIGIATVTDDLHALLIQRGLQERDQYCEIIEVDHLAGGSMMSWSDTDGEEDRCSVPTRSGQALDVRSLDAVWWRRVQRDQRLPWPLADPAQVDLVNNDCSAALAGALLTRFRGAWINDPVRAHYAENKLVQLRAAKAAGFRVPRTIVSQDPEEIRGFCHAHQTIVKPVLGTRKTGLLTRLVTERHLSSDEAMMVAPAM